MAPHTLWRQKCVIQADFFLPNVRCLGSVKPSPTLQNMGVELNECIAPFFFQMMDVKMNEFLIDNHK